jgi:hypothetical protein
MASAQKISALTTAGPLTGAELVPIVQSGGTLQTTVSTLVAFANISLIPVVSALQTQITQVSDQTSVNTAAITSINALTGGFDSRISAVSAAVSTLNIQMVEVQASISAINSVLATIDVSAVLAVETRVSALEIRVAAVSAATSANTAAITSTNNVVSALQVQVNNVSAALTSTNNVVSALEVRVSAVSATVSGLAVRVSVLEAAVSAIGDVSVIAALVSNVAILDAEVSVLDIRLTAVSAATSVNTAAITSINAVVSTKAFRNGDFLTNVQYIDFNTSASVAPTTAGELVWNVDDGTLDVGLYNGVTLQVGQETLFYIKNGAAVSIATGQLVMATSALGASGKIIGAPAIANGTISPEYFLGVAAQTIAPDDFGYVADFGLVRGFNSSGAPYGETWVDGQILYANASVTGGLTNSAPAFPGFSTPIAIVINAATGGSGSIFVRMKTGEYLRQLHDVDLVSVSNNDIIVYNTSLSAWTNSPALTVAQASISALNIQLAAVSALTSANAAAITSINNVVSALEIRVSAVSAAVSQRVLKAGDTMTGALTITTSADVQGLTVSGYATFNSRVSISAGFYTGAQNFQDNTVQRATFRDYALVHVARGSVSAVTTLDMTDGNFFSARVAGSTTFVFANPPVSVTGAAGGAAGGFALELQNGGAATVTWPSTVDWPGGVAPSLTASGFDVIVCITDDAGTNWRCVQSMRDSK